jgi:tetratricopeptide (TPR) repeat protein
MKAHTFIVFRVVFTLIVATVVVSAPIAFADQTDSRLSSLFERLRTTADEHEATVITQQIWVIWRHTDNEQVDALMDEGLHDVQVEQYDQALAVFNKVVVLAPRYAEGWNSRATLFYLMGNYPASAADVQRTLALEPRHFGAWSGLGLIYLGIGNEEAALQAFEKALAINPYLTGSRATADLIKKHLEEKSI